MTNKTITIEMIGEEETMLESIDSFAKQNGWTELVNGEPNPVTQIQKAEQVLKSFFGQTVTAYNVNEAARVAREAAAITSAEKLETITLTVTVA